MKITGQGIQGQVSQTLHNTDAQKHFGSNSVRSLPQGKRKPQPELQRFYRFKGDYFKQFSSQRPFETLGCTAQMCPDYRNRNRWFQVLTEKFNLSNQLVPLAPWASLNRSTVAYISCKYSARTAKLYIRNAYNDPYSKPLRFFTLIQQPGLGIALSAQNPRPDSQNAYVIRLPFISELETAETFFLGACPLESSSADCKFLFTIGKVLAAGLKFRPFSDVNFLFQF